MNIQIQLRKVIDWINSQPMVIAILLWFFMVVFIIIPFAIPSAVIYLIWTALKSREKVQ